MAERTEPHTRQTVLVVPNIHCPTCVTFIDDFLPRLHPRLISVATSMVSRRVTIHHYPSLTPRMVAKALDKAGYVVESIIPNPSQGDSSSIESTDWRTKSRSSGTHFFLGFLPRWARRTQASDAVVKEKRHLEHCEQCRLQSLRNGSGTDSEGKHGVARSKPASAVAGSTCDESSLDVFVASISVTGMSCSSCIGLITDALVEKPWVKTANVALITQSASVEFYGETNAASLVAAINDLGYEASLGEVKKMEALEDSGRCTWRALYSIEGMTCSSCVGAITETVQNLRYVLSTDVNLVNGSAMVVFEGKSHVEMIAEAIEDMGYGASLIEVGPNSTKSTENRDQRRTVSIRIDGLHCERCPGRVADAMEALDYQVTVEKAATVSDPIAIISYTPNAPSFTIRSIMSAISAADPAFNPRLHHPPTIEERARQMRTRGQRRLLYRVLLSFAIAVPTFVIGIVYTGLVPASNSGRRYLREPLQGVTRAEWALFVMATPVYFLAADVFHRRTIAQLRTLWKPSSTVPVLQRFCRFGSMDTLISFGTTIAYFSSIAELAIASKVSSSRSTGNNPTYFDSVVFLTMFLLIGRLIEAHSKSKTVDAVSTLQGLRPSEALLVVPNGEKEGVDRIETVSVDLIDSADIVRVVHGGCPPCDGVLEGEAIFDESSLTGESKPVKKIPGDTVYSGTINKGPPVSIQITGVSGESMLDKIIKVVREGQSHRAPIEKIADVLTSYFVPVITLVAITTWVVWLGLGLSGTLPQDYLDVEMGGWPFWSLQFAIAVFIVACPCGIGLAAPTALFVGGGLAAKHGILVKGGGEAFQEASRLDIVVFDKTGTLTEGGDLKVTDHRFIQCPNGLVDEQTALAALRELEQSSSHPLGKAIVDFCRAQSTPLTSARGDRVEELAGKGMKGSFEVDGISHSTEIIVGSEALMEDHCVGLNGVTSSMLDAWKGQAKSVVVVATRPVAAPQEPWIPTLIFAISDAIRQESRYVVQSLSRQGIQIWMITGDNSTTACAVGASIGIPRERIIAGVLPEQKADKIKDLQKSQVATRSKSFFGSSNSSQKAIVAMVGDGVNDSPALAVADVGIAVGSGSDVAISSADFVLLNSSMTTLLTLVTLSRVVFQRVKFNFGWALIYNTLALPIAAGAFYPLKSQGSHIRLDPVWASLAMALSSISVICSSLLLRSGLPIFGFNGKYQAKKHVDTTCLDGGN